jgi:hypothetical protein
VRNAIILSGVMVPMSEQDHERRRYPRFEVSFPVNFRIFGVALGDAEMGGIQGIGTRTTGRVGNISLEGLLIEANPTPDQISDIIRAKRGQDRFGVEIETNLMGENIRMIGKVVWYDINFQEQIPAHFRAGIFLEDMDQGTRQVWGKLLVEARN